MMHIKHTRGEQRYNQILLLKDDDGANANYGSQLWLSWGCKIFFKISKTISIYFACKLKSSKIYRSQEKDGQLNPGVTILRKDNVPS